MRGMSGIKVHGSVKSTESLVGVGRGCFPTLERAEKLVRGASRGMQGSKRDCGERDLRLIASAILVGLVNIVTPIHSMRIPVSKLLDETL